MSDIRDDFTSLALAGELSSDKIDDVIDRWHEIPATLPLHSFLGMSREEYELWLSAPDMLALVLIARTRGQPLQVIARESSHHCTVLNEWMSQTLEIYRTGLQTARKGRVAEFIA